MRTCFVGIDPSIRSTAMVVGDDIFIYPVYDAVFTKTGKMRDWYDRVDGLVGIRPYEREINKSYSDLEMEKLFVFANIVNMIVEDLCSITSDMDKVVIGIEGYSYSSNVGPLIDLVGFGTTMRLKLASLKNVEIRIIPPSTVKLDMCKMTYEPVITGKKTKKKVYQNDDGVKGGAFKKPEMMKSIMDNREIDNDWKRFLVDNREDILSRSSIPKPIDDINDALIIRYLVENGPKDK